MEIWCSILIKDWKLTKNFQLAFFYSVYLINCVKNGTEPAISRMIIYIFLKYKQMETNYKSPMQHLKMGIASCERQGLLHA